MGNVDGGKKAAATNKKKHGEDFYARIAKKAQDAWHENGRKPRGFSVNKDLAREAGAKGGKKKNSKTQERIEQTLTYKRAGLSNYEIAKRLDVHPQTVANYIKELKKRESLDS